MAKKKIERPALFDNSLTESEKELAGVLSTQGIELKATEEIPENMDVIMGDEGKPEIVEYKTDPGTIDITHMQDQPEKISQKVIRISQSLMKAVREYLEEKGSCGIFLKEKYIKGRLFDDSSKAMKLGCYFEYITTGALPKNGKVPQPEYTKLAIKAQEKIIKDNKKAVEDNVKIRQHNAHVKPGKPMKKLKEIKPEKVLGVADMYEPYREAHDNRDRLLARWAEMGLEIAKDKEGKPLAGWRLVKGRFDGTIDVVLRATREIVFADGYTLNEGDLISGDIKYSGLKDDRFSVHGWQWTAIQKRYHGTQAKQYNFLSDLPQTFWIVDPKGNYILFFRCVIDQRSIDEHIAEGNELHKRLIELDELGALEPRPEYNRCGDCPLYGECDYKHTFPHPVAVDLTTE